MLKSESVTFRAGAQEVWSHAIRAVQEAGYDNLEVRHDRSCFSFTGAPGKLLRAQLVVVTVLPLGDDEICVSVQVRPLTQMAFMGGEVRQELLDFIFGELEDEFPKIRRREREPRRDPDEPIYTGGRRREKELPWAAKSSGCLVIAFVVGVGGVGAVLAGRVL